MEPAARLTLQAAIDDMELGLSSLDKALEIFAARDYPEDQFQHLLPLIEGLSAIFDRRQLVLPVASTVFAGR